MEELILDRKGEPVHQGDWVLYGVPSGGLGAIGEMLVGQAIDKNRHGVSITGHDYRFRSPKKLTKVSEEFARQFIEYTQ